MTSVSLNKSKTRGENTSRNIMNNSTKLKFSSSDDEDSFIFPKIKASKSNLEQKRAVNVTKKTNKYDINSNSNEKSLKSSNKEIKRRNNKNDIQHFSDSDYSDVQIRYVHNNTSNRFNGARLSNKTLARPKVLGPINRQKPNNKSSLSLKFSSSDSSSDSIRVKKSEVIYRNINYRRNDSESDSYKRKRYYNTIDTVLESDNSDDIPFLESMQDEPEVDFKSYMKKESDKNENKNIEKTIEKDSKIEKSKKLIELDNSDENIHQKEKSCDYESDQNSTSSNNLNKEKERITTSNKKNKNFENDGIIRTKHYNSSQKYKIKKKKHKSKSKIIISSSESEEEKNETENKNENDREHQNENQTQNELSHSNSEIENKSNSDDLALDQNEENNENEEFIQTDFEQGVTDQNEVKRLCNSFMKRRPGYKLPNDLVPYKMHTDTKMSFHGKKAKFVLFRGEVPLLSAKLKYKNGSDPIVNIFKYDKNSNSKKEKKKDKTKSKEKSKNRIKITPIAIVITSSNFSTFSLLKSESKSESFLNNENEIDEFQAIHNSYGFGYGKQIMTISYTMPKVDYAPRLVNVRFNNPPSQVPKELSNRKPKFTYGSTFVLDIGGRVAKRSIKNCIMVDENDNDIMSIMKIRDSEVSIEAFPIIGELSVFAFGISSVLCKI